MKLEVWEEILVLHTLMKGQTNYKTGRFLKEEINDEKSTMQCLLQVKLLLNFPKLHWVIEGYAFFLLPLWCKIKSSL